MNWKAVLSRSRSHLLWLLVGVAGLLAVLIVSEPFQRQFGAAVVWAEAVIDQHPVMGALVFFLFSLLSALLVFASSAVLVPSASAVWGNGPTFVLLWSGWLAGSMIAFGIGRLARSWLAQTGYQDKLHKYEQYVSQRMPFWTALLVCVAIPSEIPGYLFGSMRYPWPKFLAAVGLAEAGYAMALVYAGQSLRTENPWLFGGIVGVVLTVALLARWALRRVGRRKVDGAAGS